MKKYGQRGRNNVVTNLQIAVFNRHQAFLHGYE